MRKISVALVFSALVGCAAISVQETVPVIYDRTPASDTRTQLVPNPLHGTIADINPPGFERKSAKIILPLQYANKEKWPLVILLHGIGGTGQAEDHYLTLRFRTTLKGFILITPEGTATPNGTKTKSGEDWSGKQFWNATDFCCDFGKTGVNDVDYLTKLIETAQKDYRIDADRIYVIGHSNGGFMANRLACEIGDRLAGIASLAGGSFKTADDCKKPVPVSYLQIHAVDDKTVRYDDVPEYAGGKATIGQWLKKNGCTGLGSESGKKDDIFLISGADTTPRTWNCAHGTQVAFWTIDAASVASHSAHVPIFNLNFSDEVLDFLLQQKRVRQ